MRGATSVDGLLARKERFYSNGMRLQARYDLGNFEGLEVVTFSLSTIALPS